MKVLKSFDMDVDGERLSFSPNGDTSKLTPELIEAYNLDGKGLIETSPVKEIKTVSDETNSEKEES